MPYTSVLPMPELYQEISYLMLLQEIMKINYQQKS